MTITEFINKMDHDGYIFYSSVPTDDGRIIEYRKGNYGKIVRYLYMSSGRVKKIESDGNY